MNALSLKNYLAQLCSDLDAGRPPRRYAPGRALRSLALPAALGLSSLAFTGCAAQQTPQDRTTPQVVIVQPTPVALYAAPAIPVEDCRDGADNDGDGLVDCDDADCSDADLCSAVAEYGIPFTPSPVEDCRDGVDNDGDGLVDCGDLDCQCAVALYAAPPLMGVEDVGAPPPSDPDSFDRHRPLYGVPHQDDRLR